MKKALALLLTLLVCFSMVACKGDKSSTTTTAPTSGGGGSTTAPTSGSDDYWTNAETMKIAILTPLTGTSKENGERQQRSTNVAVEGINKAGGVLGKKVEVIYFDIGADQQGFINALQSAVNTEGISATIGYAMSNFTIGGAEIILESEIPNITFGNSAGILALENPYIWMGRVPDKVSTETLAKVGHDKYNIKNLRCLDDKPAWS